MADCAVVYSARPYGEGGETGQDIWLGSAPMSCVDGFVAAVLTASKAAYKELAGQAAAVLRERGALEVVECWGDDSPRARSPTFGAQRRVQREAVERPS